MDGKDKIVQVAAAALSWSRFDWIRRAPLHALSVIALSLLLWLSALPAAARTLVEAGNVMDAAANDDGTWLAKDVPLKINPTNGAEGCSACHTERKMYIEMNGERRFLWVDQREFEASVHGSLGCLACHNEMNGGHHPKPVLTGEWVTLGMKRKLDANAIAACLNCHDKIGLQWKETVHGNAIFEDGEMEAADCADCHGYHYIKPIHDSGSPVSTENQPYTCASCHDQVNIVDKYGLSRNVFSAYKESFHGKKQEIGGLSSIAVCASCHGVHDIYKSTDPRSRVNDRNLAATCGGCHYGSEYGFAHAFTHEPKPARWHDVLLIIEQVYLYVITIAMAGFALHILLDFMRTKLGGGRH